MPQRLRVRDERSSLGPATYEHYAKAACNATPPVWTVYFNSGARDVGTYTNMTDVTGNPPRPKDDGSGYVCNNMDRVSASIDAGSGTDWEVETKAAFCTAPFQYFQRARRKANGLTIGRHFSRFSHAVSPADGKIVAGELISSSELDRVVKFVSTEVLSKRGRGSSKSNLYESLAEFDKTLGLLQQYMDRFRKIYVHAVRKNPRAFVGDATALYLMTRYGLMPTVKDIQNTIRALNANLGSIVETTRSQYSYVEKSTLNSTIADVNTINIHGTTTITSNVTVRGWSVDQYELTLTDALGLNSKNLLTVAWELQKWSFVYDWVANIGSYIGALVPSFGVKQLTSGYTIEIEQIRQYVITGSTLVDPSVHTLVTAPSGSCTMSVRSKRRVAGLLAPSLVIVPDFKTGSLLRVLDAFSLLFQQMGKFRK